ncbi:MAG: hypothetical protein EAZ08_06980 [Cytophagales bacterium]|nr:MAG: hypothetical protein EAZ08_06980 [Cytophagales bacterium]
MILFNALKKLPQGYYRLVIASLIVIPLFVASIITALNNADMGIFAYILTLSIIIYYLLARIGIWIYEGFNNQKNNKTN